MAEDCIRRFPKTKRLTNEQVLMLWDKVAAASQALLDAEHDLGHEHVCQLCGRDSFEDHQQDCICGTFRLTRFQVDKIQETLEQDYPQAFEDEGDDQSATTESTEV